MSHTWISSAVACHFKQLFFSGQNTTPYCHFVSALPLFCCLGQLLFSKCSTEVKLSRPEKHAVLVYGHQLYNHDLALQSPCRHVCSYSGFLTPLPPAPSKLAQSKGSLEHPSRQNAECFALFFCSVSSGVCRETITCPSHVAGKPS